MIYQIIDKHYVFERKEPSMKNSSWKHSIFYFLTAQTISLLGSSLVQYAIIWHLTLSTSSGKVLTIATICGFLPQILISLFAGVWLDQYDRKKIIMYADTMIALATLCLAISFFAGHKNMLLIFLALIIRSGGTGIQTPAVNAILPQIVPQEKLMQINGIQSTISSLMMFLSPVVSGMILSVTSLEITLLIDVFTAIIGVGIMSRIPIKPYQNNTEKRKTNLEEIKAGVLYLTKNPFLKRLLIFQILILFLISPSAFLTPLMVSRSFGAEIWRLTASEMTYSLGMILGGLFITAWGRVQRKINTILSASAFYGLCMIGLGSAPTFFIYLLCNMLIGITAPCYNAPITVTIQEKVAPHMHGRVFSFMQIATSCALPLGMAFFGPLADMVIIQTILFITGALVSFLSLFVWCTNYFN